MEYIKKDELYKNRGYAKCISCGYHTMVNNYKSIFSYTWKAALAYFLVNIIALSITNGFSMPTTATDWVVWSVMLLATLLSQFYLISHIVNIYTCQGKTTMFRKTITLFLWGLLIWVLFAVFIYAALALSFSQQFSNGVIYGILAVISIVMIVLGIPFKYLAIKYLNEDEKFFFNVIRKSYYRGFSHWGLIFVTLLLSVFFVIVASFIIALPLYILVMAKLISDTGILFGDASGMPSYFPYVFSITVSFISIVLMYLNSFVFSTLYYTYGSIEQRENERIGFMESSMGV